MAMKYAVGFVALTTLAPFGCGARTSLDADGESAGEGGHPSGTSVTSSTTTSDTSTTTTSMGCAPGETRGCYSGAPETRSVGVCRDGVETCRDDGTFGPCEGEVLPSVDACNQLDDDCDGGIDENGCAVLEGCADGTREGFDDAGAFPNVAGCSGGFQIPGLLSELAATCDHQAGDDSNNPDGDSCSAEDLCGPGFHVCLGADDFLASAPGGCSGVTTTPGLFFASRQSSPGCGLCALGSIVSPACDTCQCVEDCLQTDLTANDVFGCGTSGDTPSTCGPFDRFGNDLCSSLPPPWRCGSDGCNEAHAVTKPGSDAGGVLCCR